MKRLANAIAGAALAAIVVCSWNLYADTVGTSGNYGIQESGGGGISSGGSSTDNAICRWDGTGGDTLQDSAPTIADNGNMTIAAGDTLAYASANGFLLQSNVGASQGAYGFVGDTDTGMYLVTADAVGLNAGGISLIQASEVASVGYVRISGHVFRPPVIEGTSPTEPVACSNSTVFNTVCVDDTDDGAVAACCICLDTDDGSTFDWRLWDDRTAACPFF